MPGLIPLSLAIGIAAPYIADSSEQCSGARAHRPVRTACPPHADPAARNERLVGRRVETDLGDLIKLIENVAGRPPSTLLAGHHVPAGSDEYHALRAEGRTVHVHLGDDARPRVELAEVVRREAGRRARGR